MAYVYQAYSQRMMDEMYGMFPQGGARYAVGEPGVMTNTYRGKGWDENLLNPSAMTSLDLNWTRTYYYNGGHEFSYISECCKKHGSVLGGFMQFGGKFNILPDNGLTVYIDRQEVVSPFAHLFRGSSYGLMMN